MSFDLYFYKRKDSDLTEEKFATYLNQNLPFNISDHPRQWNYENPETGVYFIIDWNDAENEVDEDGLGNFEGLAALNFSVSINFFRPCFFGLEIFPIIERIVAECDLLMLNPQDEIEPDRPIKFNNGYLQEQWSRHNEKVSKDHFEEFEFGYMSPERAKYIWWHQLHRTELQNSLKEDIFVAGILLLESKADKKLYTICVWPEHIPIIIPRVDYIVITKKYKSFFKDVEESGIVAYDTIMHEFEGSFETFESDVPELKVLNQEKANRIKKQFNNLKIISSVGDFGILISMDSFVTARP